MQIFYYIQCALLFASEWKLSLPLCVSLLRANSVRNNMGLTLWRTTHTHDHVAICVKNVLFIVDRKCSLVTYLSNFIKAEVNYKKNMLLTK